MKKTVFKSIFFLSIALLIQQDTMYAMKRNGNDNNKRSGKKHTLPKKHKSIHIENDIYVDVHTPENNDPLQNRLVQRVLREGLKIQNDGVQSSLPHNNYPNNSWFSEWTDTTYPMHHDFFLEWTEKPLSEQIS